MTGFQSMSRSHLYRSTNRARPLTTIILAAVWMGATLGLFAMAGAQLLGGLPLQGPAAAMVDRASWALAIAAAVIGGAMLAREIVMGRTVYRGVRMIGAGVLLAAGVAGLWDTLRFAIRPGTPVANAAPANETVPVTVSTEVGLQRVLWTTAGLLGAVLMIGGGVAGLEQRRPRL